MSNQKSLVLVVGAGASKEVKLPIGSELKDRIAAALNFKFRNGYQLESGDSDIAEAIQLYVQNHRPNGSTDVNPFIRAGRRIRDAMPQAPSIDNFIHAHQDDEKIALCGKLAIAKCILEAEAQSMLHMSRETLVNFVDVKDTWYNLFFQYQIAPFKISDLPERLSKITIITFNYDRCIEHYFHSGLMNYYGIDGVQATGLMKHLTILHPYGYLGPLAWSDVRNPIPFGTKVHPAQLLEIAQNLKTFTEGTDKTHSDIVSIKQSIDSAEKIVFLGFSFNSQNLELLFSDIGVARRMRSVEFFGTAYGLSASDIFAIKNQLKSLAQADHGSPVILEQEHTCAKLIQDYSRALTV